MASLMRRSREFLFAILFLANCLSDASAAPIQPVNVSGLPVVSGAGNSFTPLFSGDARFVVFVSEANNLVTNDNRALFLDVFVRDLALNRTTLVSVNSSGTGGGDDNSNLPTVSSNGQFIVFESEARNLAALDTNRATDVFVRDVLAGVTTLVSVSTNNMRSGNGPSSNPTMTPDGRWVAFESAASDLVADDTNGVPDVFVRDLLNGVTSLVSVGYRYESGSPAITPDGRLVAFVTRMSSYVPPGGLSWTEMYMRDLQANTTTKISVEIVTFFSAGHYPPHCFAPVLSADGRFVAYKASIPYDSDAPARLFRYELQAGTTLVVSTNTPAANPPEISADGRLIAYEDGTNVFVWDGQTGTNILASVRLDGALGGNRPSSTPVLVSDGSKVVFLSAASDPVMNATNGTSQVFVRDLVAGTTRLVSANLTGGPSSADIDVTLPAISTDGRLVAFESGADDLVSQDFNYRSDIFVRDLEANTTRLISEHEPALGASSGVATISVAPNCLSADGGLVAFVSRDGNLSAGDSNQYPDAYVRDLLGGTNYSLLVPGLPSPPPGGTILPAISAGGRYAAFVQQETNFLFVWRRDLQTGTNERVSVAGAFPFAALRGTAPAISSNGQMVAFQSTASASGFVPEIFSGTTFNNVVLHDFQTGTNPPHNEIISVNRFGYITGNSDSAEPLFSPDGRWVLFTSSATDLLATNTPFGFPRVFIRDLTVGITRLVSVGPDGSVQWGYAHNAAFSADSRFVACVSEPSNVVVVGLFDQSHILVCSNCENPSIGGNGRLVAYETRPDAITPSRQVMLKDLQTGAASLVSISRKGTAGDGHSVTPQMSPDGRFVVFASKAGNLVEDDTNRMTDIFVRDRLLGTTMLVSVNTQGTGSGNAASTQPLMAADGRTVVFQSFANDLIPGDFNDRRNIFVLHLGGLDSDADGLDDDWEMTYFGNLSRDGSGDFDHDGHTDREEFLAGTNPINDVSVLRVLTVTGLNGGSTTILWNAVSGRTYRVQFKNGVDDPQWRDLPGDITPVAATAAAVDASAGAQAHRFYRVVRLP